MTAKPPHSQHPYRDSDQAVILMVIATVISSMWVTVISFLTALGSGLASTPQSRVPHESNVLWGISGFGFLACFTMLVLTAVTRRRPYAIGLGTTVLGAGLVLCAGNAIEWIKLDPAGSLIDAVGITNIIVPVLAGVVIFWKSRELRP